MGAATSGAGQMLGGRFKVNLAAGELAKIEAGGDAPEGAIDVDLDFTGLSIAYMDDLPPVLTGDAKLTIKGTEFSVDIPQGKVVVPSSGQEIALSDGRFYVPDLRPETATGGHLLQGIRRDAHGSWAARRRAASLSEGRRAETRLSRRHRRGRLHSVDAAPGRPRVQGRQAPRHGAARPGDRRESDRRHGYRGRFDRLEPHRGGGRGQGRIQIKGVPAQIAWQRIFYASNDQPAADQGDGQSRRGGAREARLQGQPSGQGDDAGHAVGHRPRRRLSEYESQRRSHRCAAPVRQHGLDQTGGASAPIFSSTWRRKTTVQPSCKT